MPTQAICSVPDCSNSAATRGFCARHYARFKRWGDPLGGRATNVGEPRRYLEAVVLPHTGDDCLIWPYGRSAGYGAIYSPAIGQNEFVHRIACAERHGPPPSPDHEAAHSCGNGHEGCVNPEHLRWATRGENAQDMVAHGRSCRAEKAHFTKLDEQKVREIRALKGVEPQRVTARRYGVSQPAIRYIQIRKNWAWVE